VLILFLIGQVIVGFLLISTRSQHHTRSLKERLTEFDQILYAPCHILTWCLKLSLCPPTLQCNQFVANEVFQNVVFPLASYVFIIKKVGKRVTYPSLTKNWELFWNSERCWWENIICENIIRKKLIAPTRHSKT